MLWIFFRTFLFLIYDLIQINLAALEMTFMWNSVAFYIKFHFNGWILRFRLHFPHCRNHRGLRNRNIQRAMSAARVISHSKQTTTEFWPQPNPGTQTHPPTIILTSSLSCFEWTLWERRWFPLKEDSMFSLKQACVNCGERETGRLHVRKPQTRHITVTVVVKVDTFS